MTNKKRLDVIAWRALRKTSHLSNKIVRKSSHFLDRVENKTSKIIISKTGAPDGRGNVALEEIMSHNFPYLTPIYPSLPLVGQKPAVTVLTFLHPNGFYGGVATTLFVAAELANKLGYDLKIVTTTNHSAKYGDVLAFLKTNGITIEAERFSLIDAARRTLSHQAHLPIHPDDVFLASAWWDAYVASQLPLVKKFIYLIQDFEPIFYNNSDAYVFADQTYRSEKFIPICNTELLYTYFAKNDYNYIKKNALWFEPTPAPKLPPSPRKAKDEPRKLFLYGRPSVHRNLYFTAIQALDKAFQDERLQSQQWELCAAGQADLASVRLSSGQVIKNLGKMDWAEYYKFAQTVDVAVSPMLAPHPNYPTLEFAALGSMVVSTKWQTKQDLSRYSPNILMAEPTIEDMAEKIIAAALTNDATRTKGTTATKIGDNWTKTLQEPIAKLAQRIKD